MATVEQIQNSVRALLGREAADVFLAKPIAQVVVADCVQDATKRGRFFTNLGALASGVEAATLQALVADDEFSRALALKSDRLKSNVVSTLSGASFKSHGNLVGFIEKFAPRSLAVQAVGELQALGARTQVEAFLLGDAVQYRAGRMVPGISGEAVAVRAERVVAGGMNRMSRALNRPVMGPALGFGALVLGAFGLREYFRGADRENRFTMVPVPQPGMMGMDTAPVALPPQAMAFGPSIGDASTLSAGRNLQGKVIDPSLVLAAGGGR